jgi:hypothetical protein
MTGCAGTDLAQLAVAAPGRAVFLRRINVMKRILALSGLLVAVAALSIGCQKKETTTTTTETATTQQAPPASGTPEASTSTATTTTTTVEVTPTATSK